MEINSRKRMQPEAAILFAVAVLLAAIAVPLNFHNLLLFSLLPLLLSICFRITVPKFFRAVLKEDALVVLEPVPDEIAYDDIQSLTMGGRQLGVGSPATGAICVNHRRGTLTIPEHLNMRSAPFYEALLARVPNSGADPSHEVLAKIAQEAREEFGHDRVWCYSARNRRGRRVASSRQTVIGAGFFFTGALWLLMALVFKDLSDAWSVFGPLLFIVGFGWWAIAKSVRVSSPAKIQNRKGAGIVITPKQIGLVQGDLQGNLSWEEIVTLKLGGKTKHFQLTNGFERHSIIMQVDGAVLTIADIYDRPLPVIFERLRDYWRPAS